MPLPHGFLTSTRQSDEQPSPLAVLPSSHPSIAMSTMPSPQTEPTVSDLHTDEQPSPLAVLPSTHCSPLSTIPSPHSHVR